MLTGKKFPQNVRALRIVTEEVLRDVIKEAVNESDLKKVLNDDFSE